MFRNAWQLNLAELQAKFILGEGIVLERGEYNDKMISAFNLLFLQVLPLISFLNDDSWTILTTSFFLEEGW